MFGIIQTMKTFSSKLEGFGELMRRGSREIERARREDQGKREEGVGGVKTSRSKSHQFKIEKKRPMIY